MKSFPTLYKKNSNGSLQFWEIQVKSANEVGADLSSAYSAGIILTRFGQLGTDSPQTAQDTVTEGKNTGKANATTAYEQACREAQSKWEKQKKKGYVETKEAAEADEVDDVIEGGIAPMLAHKFKDHEAKIKYPCYVQPKLDGMRCIAILKDGKCTLWTRTRKRINSCPHIVKEIESVLKGDWMLDGELYNHDLRDNLEAIISLARQSEPAEGHETVQYHVYDLPCPGTFQDRAEKLYNLLHTASKAQEVKYLKIVPTARVLTAAALDEAFQRFLEDRYEGAMARNADGPYVNKRSYDLQKIKSFEEDEFKIVGVEEGRGKYAGLVARFVCETPEGYKFYPPFNAPLKRLREMYDDRTNLIGKQLTVRYLRYSHTDKPVPYGCKGRIVRDYE